MFTFCSLKFERVLTGLSVTRYRCATVIAFIRDHRALFQSYRSFEVNSILNFDRYRWLLAVTL